MITTLNDGKSALTFGTTPYKLNHKLKRKPIGYQIMGQNGASVIQSSASDSQTITLFAAGSVTALAIWVF